MHLLFKTGQVIYFYFLYYYLIYRPCTFASTSAANYKVNAFQYLMDLGDPLPPEGFAYNTCDWLRTQHHRGGFGYHITVSSRLSFYQLSISAFELNPVLPISLYVTMNYLLFIIRGNPHWNCFGY